MADMAKTWVGVAGGAGIAIIGGISVSFVKFVNMKNPSVSMLCGVSAARLGVVAHMGGGAAIAIMTGVSKRADVKGLKSSGVDFAIDIGAKFGAMIKTGGNAARAVKALAKVDDLSTLKVWAGSEGAKAVVNGLTGDLNLSDTKPSFAMFSTPAGVGAGAGVWYEWQKVQGLDGGTGWDFCKPSWRLQRHMGHTWLQMGNIPCDDGTELFFTFREERWGRDHVLSVSDPTWDDGISICVGEVRDHWLFEPKANRMKATPPKYGGINLTWRKLREYADGKYIKLKAGREFGLSFDVAQDGKSVWEAGGYYTIKTDSEGRFGTIVKPTKSKWVQ